MPNLILHPPPPVKKEEDANGTEITNDKATMYRFFTIYALSKKKTRTRKKNYQLIIRYRHYKVQDIPFQFNHTKNQSII